jgi:hypothetical protein
MIANKSEGNVFKTGKIVIRGRLFILPKPDITILHNNIMRPLQNYLKIAFQQLVFVLSDP